MVEAIYTGLENRVNLTNPDLKYFGLSGHDDNITPFQVQLGLSSIDCTKYMIVNNGKIPTDKKECLIVPGFASNFVHELTQKSEGDKGFYIRLFLNGKRVDFCTKDKAEGEGYCPFTEAKKLAYSTFALSDKDFVTQCGLTTASQKDSSSSQLIWFIVVVILLVTVIIFLVTYIFVIANKKGSYQRFEGEKLLQQNNKSDGEEEEEKDQYIRDDEFHIKN